MKKLILSSLIMATLCGCSSSDDEKKDMTYPLISDEGITAFPTDCQVYNRGEVIPFNYILSDDTELGAYNIDIPTDIDPGDYHFMLRLTDRAGWQQLHSVAIKIR